MWWGGVGWGGGSVGQQPPGIRTDRGPLPAIPLCMARVLTLSISFPLLNSSHPRACKLLGRKGSFPGSSFRSHWVLPSRRSRTYIHLTGTLSPVSVGRSVASRVRRGGTPFVKLELEGSASWRFPVRWTFSSMTLLQVELFPPCSRGDVFKTASISKGVKMEGLIYGLQQSWGRELRPLDTKTCPDSAL